MAAVSRATQVEAMRWMESEVRAASQRKRLAKRIASGSAMMETIKRTMATIKTSTWA
jgi:hypothetical protein